MGKVEQYIKDREEVFAKEQKLRPFRQREWMFLKESRILVCLIRLDPLAIQPVYSTEDIGTGPGMSKEVESMEWLQQNCDRYERLMPES